MALTFYMNKRRYLSPLGPIWLAAKNDALVGAWFAAQKHFPKEFVLEGINSGDAVLIEAERQLAAYFEKKLHAFTLPLAPVGTAFQSKVWGEIARIPFGETITYGALARATSSEKASRAAGAATGRNPISIIIPCHRVIAGSGAMTGYAGGLDRKRALLALEGAQQSTQQFSQQLSL
jgi:methylated-DNA-[protein]-cysteine S-methyltransferase